MNRSVRKVLAQVMLCCFMMALLGCQKPVAKQTIDTGTGQKIATNESSSQAQVKATRVNLSGEEKKKLDIFFSNFSEVEMESFAYGTLSDDQLIRFGILHQVRNKYNFGKGTANIPAVEVEQAQDKYFGRVAKGNEKQKYIGGWCLYENGIYHMQLGTGFVPPFSQIDELWDNGDDAFTAIGSIYWAYDGWSGDPHSTMEEWKKGDTKFPEFKGKYRAIIRPIADGESKRYILLEYKLEK